MSYDQGLAQRIHDFLVTQPELMEKKMFGGLCYMLQGNMCCGVVGNKLVLRINGPKYDELLEHKHISVVDFTGKPMRGFLYVDPTAIKTQQQLLEWLSHSIDYCLSLPPK
jgi:TfoX/Sxy family transcriptional regulator of competence genes